MERKISSLSIVGSNDDELFRIAEKFMYVLDEKYDWLGMLPNIGTKNMMECMQKAGLWGGVLYEKE